MPMYPKGSTRREKKAMNALAVLAFLVLVVAASGFWLGEATIEFMATVMGLLFLVVVSMEIVVVRILARNKGWTL